MKVSRFLALSFFVLMLPGIVLLVPETNHAMDFVYVGDAGNTDDSTGLGAVSYEYRIGTYEVTNSQYAEMLNSVGGSDPFGLYHIDMSGTYGGILRNGSEGSYTYTIKSDWDNKPVNFVSWRDAARFTNWLDNGMTNDPNSTEYGAYDASTFGGLSPDYTDQDTHDRDALYWIPTVDEWYKAAYYDPTLNSGSGGYYAYPTQSNNTPTAEAPAGGSNSANYDSVVGNVTDVGAYANSTSYYGTFDQAGNLSEWNEQWVGGGKLHRGLRGGAFSSNNMYIHSSSSFDCDMCHSTPAPYIFESKDVGFRIAAVVPEPISSTLFIIGGATLGFRRFWKKCKK